MTDALPRTTASTHWLWRRPWALSLLFTTTLFAISLAVFTPVYETNDDVVISMIASGTGINIAPDEHLVFSHVGIGLALKELYSLCPAISWYWVYLLGVQFLSFWALAYAVFSWGNCRRELPRYVLFFVAAGLPLLMTVQFTRVGCTSAECGILLALSGLLRRARCPTHASRVPIVCGIALMVLGSLVRHRSFFAAVAIAAPGVAWILWRAHRQATNRGSIWRPAALVAIVAFGLVTAAHWIDRSYYDRDPAWRDFLEVNLLRARFNDTLRLTYTPETKPLYNRANWSENDHALIVNWFFDDPRVYNAENFHKIIDGLPPDPAFPDGPPAEVWQAVLQDSTLWPLFLCLPALIWSVRDRRLAMECLALTAVALAVVLTCVMYLKAPPARVYAPMFAFLPMSLLVPTRRAGKQIRAKRPRTSSEPITRSSWSAIGNWFGRSLWAVGALASVAVLVTTFADSQVAVERNTILKAELAALAPCDDQLFVCWSSCFGYEAILPADSPASFAHLHTLCMGWMQQSPINRKVKEHFQIDDLAEALSARPNVFLISLAPLNEMYSQFCREHHGLELQWEARFEGPQFTLWKPTLDPAVAELHKTGPPPSPRR